MRRRTGRPLGRACALTLGLGLLAGCATHPAPPISAPELKLARQFPLFTFYWVGQRFQGIPLTAADSRREYDATVGMRVYYGDCRPNGSLLSTKGCVLPLEIATLLHRPHSKVGLGARRATVIRGAPAELYHGGSSIQLYTGHLEIDIYADNPSLALAAARAVVPLNRGTDQQPRAFNAPPPAAGGRSSSRPGHPRRPARAIG